MSASSQIIKLNDVQQIDSNLLAVLRETIYPGAKDESIAMVINYCKARKLDPIKKPVHLVPMNVKTGRKDNNGKDIYEYRDVVMPGIGLYRIEADRSGQYAGMSEPEFGEDVTEVIGSVKLTYPKWCKITVYKRIGDTVVGFTAKEFWKENYATKSRSDSSPNQMWEKRAYGQLAKCAEAQALRKAFPDAVGQDYTKEEMEGKHHIDVNEDNKKISSVRIVNNLIDDKQEPVIEKARDIDMDCMDISWANDLESLQTIYTESYKYWVSLRNKENLDRLIKAKDKRKLELESDEAKAGVTNE